MRPLVYKMLVHQVERLGIDIEYNRRIVDSGFLCFHGGFLGFCGGFVGFFVGVLD